MGKLKLLRDQRIFLKGSVFYSLGPIKISKPRQRGIIPQDQRMIMKD